MSANLPAGVVEHLKREEGWRALPYRDHLGYLTIGYGFLIDERKPVPLPREVGDVWLGYAVQERWRELLERRPWIAQQPAEVQCALCSMAYQLGVGGLLKFQRMLGALERGDREAAARAALESRWAQQTPARAQRVAAMLRG